MNAGEEFAVAGLPNQVNCSSKSNGYGLTVNQRTSILFLDPLNSTPQGIHRAIYVEPKPDSPPNRADKTAFEE